MRYGQDSEAAAFEGSVQKVVREACQDKAANRFQNLRRRFWMASDKDHGVLDFIEESQALPWGLLLVVLDRFGKLSLRQRVEADALH